MKTMKTWLGSLLMLGLLLGPAGSASADLSDWFSECTLGTTFNAFFDGSLFGVPFIGIGNEVRAGDCGEQQPDLHDFHFRQRPGSLHWGAGLVTTSGKLSADLQRQYGFDTDNNGLADTWSAWGNVWRWRKQSANEYYKATYLLGSEQIVSGKLSMSLTPGQLPGSQSSPRGRVGVWMPAGYTYLYDISHRSTPPFVYAIWVNGKMIRFVSKRIYAQSFVADPSWRYTTVVEANLGKIIAKSVPANGKYYQHIVFRPGE